MTLEYFVSYLKKNSLFRHVNKSGLKDIAGQISLVDVKKGNIIYFQGDQPESVYLVEKGYVKLSRITPDGRELTLSIFKTNDMFGEVAMLNRIPHDTAAEAITGCTLFQINRSNLFQILNSYPSVAIEVSALVGHRLSKLEEKFQITVSRDISSRIACALLYLAEEFGKPTRKGVIISLPLTHLEIASFIGSTRETTCVTLNQFRRKGWIQSEKRNLVLLNLKALRSLCET
jgi:CRP-like cAMP-binding protein